MRYAPLLILRRLMFLNNTTFPYPYSIPPPPPGYLANSAQIAAMQGQTVSFNFDADFNAR